MKKIKKEGKNEEKKKRKKKGQGVKYVWEKRQERKLDKAKKDRENRQKKIYRKIHRKKNPDGV